MENDNLGLWTIVTRHQDISSQSKFFGLISNLIYMPTGSKLRFTTKYYVPKWGNDLKALFTKSEQAIVKQADEHFFFDNFPNGNFMLELFYAKDKQFVAFRLHQFSDLDYHPITDVRCFTGKAAEALCRMVI